MRVDSLRLIKQPKSKLWLPACLLACTSLVLVVVSNSESRPALGLTKLKMSPHWARLARPSQRPEESGCLSGEINTLAQGEQAYGPADHLSVSLRDDRARLQIGFAPVALVCLC